MRRALEHDVPGEGQVGAVNVGVHLGLILVHHLLDGHRLRRERFRVARAVEGPAAVDGTDLALHVPVGVGNGQADHHLAPQDLVAAGSSESSHSMIASTVFEPDREVGKSRSEARQSSEPVKLENSRAFYEKIARQGNVIVMGANMRSKFMMLGIFLAAKVTGAPVLIQRSISEFVKGYTTEDLVRDAQEAAEVAGYTGDWMVKLDHGTITVDSEEAIQKVINFVNFAKAAGFASFSIDASKLVDFSKPTVAEQQKRNIEVTARIVKETGIENGAWEGEIGEIVGGHNALSTFEEAVTFIKGIVDLGVRAPALLAINNGSEHGNASDMKIDLQRTKEVADAIKPWGVLINQHGITGTPLNLFSQIAASGIINGNVATHWQNIMWDVLNEKRPDIVAQALKELGIDAYRSKDWDKKIRNFEPQLNELLAVDRAWGLPCFFFHLPSSLD